MMNFKAAKLAIAAAGIGTAVIVSAQLGGAPQFAKVHGYIAKSIHSGKTANARIAVEVPLGFHIYSTGFKGVGTPTQITLKSVEGIKIQGISAPKGDELSGKVVFVPKLYIPKNVHGKRTLDFTIRFQQCNEKICLPPKTEHITLTTNVR